MSSVVLFAAIVVGSLVFPSDAAAQNAELTGFIRDAQGAVVSDAAVTLVDQATGRTATTRTNSRGIYTFASVRPSTYDMAVSAQGFAEAQKTGIVLNVSQRASLDVEMTVAAVAESVTVSERDAFLRSTDGSIGTVIDRKFAANLPVNGRTFGALLALSPGVVPAPTNIDDGQYSVNGQRSASNYLMVDGVAATAGMGRTTQNTLAGQRSATTIVGGLNGLVSMDALQEIRIQTSSFSPEFGRTPGGQISVVTRSGTNVLRGSAFEQFRDDSMAANNYFSNALGLDASKTPLSQHQFGATMGGPLLRNRTFFFGSYEGLRLDQPRTAIEGVPSREARQQATGLLRDLFNAYPEPNGPNRADGSADFALNTSTRTEADTWGLRVDHAFGNGIQTFARYSRAPSESRDYRILQVLAPRSRAESITAGATKLLNANTLLDARFVYSRDETLEVYEPAGGTLRSFFPSSLPSTAVLLANITNVSGLVDGPLSENTVKQWNLVTSASYVLQAHHFKAGLDYRSVDPTIRATEQRLSVSLGTVNQALTGFARSIAVDRRFPVNGVFDSVSLFAQDTWKLHSRVTLSYGVRWDLNLAPRFKDGEGPLAANLGSVTSDLSLSPERNQPVWNTQYDDFAPRLGFSYVISPERRLTLSGGVGVFGDLQGQAAGVAFSPFTVPNGTSVSRSNLRLPLTPADVQGIDTPTVTPPFSQQVAVIDPNLSMPRTTQGNLSLEKGFGANQYVSATYVKARGDDLLQTRAYRGVNTSFPGAVFLTSSNGRSTYESLQLEYRRRAAVGLQLLAGYTLGRSRDTVSATFASDPGAGLAPSNFDVRHVFNMAASWDLPSVTRGPLSWALRDWGVHVLGMARSGTPFSLTSSSVLLPGEIAFARLSVVDGQPIIVEDPSAPRGQRFNRDAFTAPPPGEHGNTGRNQFRGFAAYQVDLGLQRSIRLTDRTRFQLRVDAFNVLNTANFGLPVTSLTDARFGTPTQTLNEAGGFDTNRLYRTGGPRTIELAARIEF